MTKAQALALVNALEGQLVPCSAVLSFPAAGGELWTVTIPPDHPLSGQQLSQLATYCQQQGLGLSAQFNYLGIV